MSEKKGPAREKEEDQVQFGDELPVLPIRNAVLFPGAVAPFDVGREKSVALVEDVDNFPAPVIAIFAQKDPATDDPGADDLHQVGCAARVLKALKHSSGNYSLILQGLTRIKLEDVSQNAPYLKAKVKRLEESGVDDDEAEALSMSLRDIAKQVIQLMPELPREAGSLIDSIQAPGALADLVAANLDAPVEEKAQLLETVDAKERIRKVLRLLTRQLEILKMRERINSQIKEEMGKNQREYVLRQQLKAIKEELGDLTDEEEEDLDELAERIKKAGLPPDVEKVANKEMSRLKTIPAASSEYTVARTYLEWLADIPWTKKTEDNLDIENARKVLDTDHYDIQKVKKRILEYLAVRKLKNDMRGPILCLVGPPGVGKTSLGQSIARSIGRKFVRLSLGGVRDEAEIRGHRRTYVGAMPGRIIQSMKKAGTINPVMMLDEIDKLGADFRGDPSAALLEVLDPEQNKTFRDHYLNVDFDLSKVLFIATANLLDPIPGPLKDRMEVIRIAGYTDRDKLHISKRHILPKQLDAHGLTPELFEVSDRALKTLIRGWTREAGLRNLERQTAKLCRKVARRVAEGRTRKTTVTAKSLPRWLGPMRYVDDPALAVDEVGVSTGLAWTQAGGEILQIEASATPGKSGLILTGQLGDVMKESARAALTWVRSRAKEFGIEPSFFDEREIHVHVPAGAIPKDGPSAGIAMATALVSVATGIPARHDVAMTGEMTLRGRVMPIGGLKEKLMAAMRHGIREVLIPAGNEKDLAEVPSIVARRVRIVPVRTLDEVIERALATRAAPTAANDAPGRKKRSASDPR